MEIQADQIRADYDQGAVKMIFHRVNGERLVEHGSATGFFTNPAVYGGDYKQIPPPL